MSIFHYIHQYIHKCILPNRHRIVQRKVHLEENLDTPKDHSCLYHMKEEEEKEKLKEMFSLLIKIKNYSNR